MTEGFFELDKTTFNKLKNNNYLLEMFGYKVATNSCFKPFEYGYFGSRLLYDNENNKYYLVWKYNEERKIDGI